MRISVPVRWRIKSFCEASRRHTLAPTVPSPAKPTRRIGVVTFTEALQSRVCLQIGQGSCEWQVLRMASMTASGAVSFRWDRWGEWVDGRLPGEAAFFMAKHYRRPPGPAGSARTCRPQNRRIIAEMKWKKFFSKPPARHTYRHASDHRRFSRPVSQPLIFPGSTWGRSGGPSLVFWPTSRSAGVSSFSGFPRKWPKKSSSPPSSGT